MPSSKYEKIPFENGRTPVRVLLDLLPPPDGARALGPRWHEQLELLYFHEGGAQVECGDRRYDAHTGDLFVVNPLEIHEVAPGVSTARYDCIMIDPSVYRNALDRLCRSRFGSLPAGQEISFHTVVHDRTAAELAQVLLREFRRAASAAGPFFESLVEAAVAALFCHEFAGFVPARDKLRTVSRYQRLAPAFQAMESRYDQPLTTAALAAQCAVTPAYFCRVFRAATGQTPMEYLCEARLSRAEALLRTTDLSIGEIARRVGFEDNCYFSRRFRRAYGFAPRELRAR